MPEHVAYFHFDGGLRDFFVGRALAKQSTIEQLNKANSVVFSTEDIRNVRMSLDHNSQLYSRPWLN